MGREMTEDEEQLLKLQIIEKYEREGNPYYSTARIWDDGIILPTETRQALHIGIAASLNAPIPESHYGVFRM
jgi:acetyl-CoA carboxylase carboxyltransferase component